MATMNDNHRTEDALVSVVIPTIGRNSLLKAVQSVSLQTVPTEIIVVLDVPERQADVAAMLSGTPHRLLLTSGRAGGGRARNQGTRTARGTHIAYLDDDDTWEPEKLALQLQALKKSADPASTVCLTSTRFVRISNGRESSTVLPRTFFHKTDQGIGDYLVQRKDLRYGRTFMQTSSILGPAELIRSYPWSESLRKHQDWDLFCRMFSAHSDVKVLHVRTPLVEVFQASSGSVSGRADWEASAEWFRTHGRSLSRRGRADFVWSQTLRASLRQRSWPGLRFSARHLADGLPHVSAAMVGLSGLLKR